MLALERLMLSSRDNDERGDGGEEGSVPVLLCGGVCLLLGWEREGEGEGEGGRGCE